jgi:muramoyltetrapeptide carboxypeptidase LdcA involved in peptidoglycan recycling
MVRPVLAAPPRVALGDRVAIVSPSFAAPAVFPAVHELAMERIRNDLGLVPVEYPTTRRLDAAPSDRAADLMDAFSDPEIRAVMATIGGDDQLTVLPHLDPTVVAAYPKPFVGYSDNTNLLNWLWNLGIVGYHGGSTMVHLGRGGGLHPVSIGSLRRALFGSGEMEITPVPEFSEDEVDWASPEALTTSGPTQAADVWSWHNADRVVEGLTWGGNLEVLHWNLAACRWIREADDYAGCILLIETSEEMPSATEVQRMLRNFGERGLLAQFAAVVVGRPKSGGRHAPSSNEAREAYRAQQRTAVLGALATYNPEATVVFGVDIGHTDPQWVIPYGGPMRLDGGAGTIHVRF